MSEALKPRHHCKVGTSEHAIPMPVNRRVVSVDFCIADVVSALNAGGLITTGSCCGHGKTEATILLVDGRVIVIGDRKLLKDKHF